MAGYLSRRWRGEAPLSRLYWRDMLAVGSFFNLLTGFIALMLLAKGVDSVVAATVHFVMLPYNVFLVLALWRTPQRSQFMAWTAVLWLVVMTLL